jgi:hypothetical protein
MEIYIIVDITVDTNLSMHIIRALTHVNDNITQLNILFLLFNLNTANMCKVLSHLMRIIIII